MDLMNKQTTKQLSDLEFMIEKLYKEAGGKVIKDLEKVMAKLDTDLTPQQQLNYLQQKKRLESLLERLVDDINNANIQAIQMLNDELIDTYINNQKYGAYLVENASGFKVDWALYNKQTIKQIMLGKDNLFYQMALDNFKDKDLIYRALQRELVQSILLGESIPKIAKRVQKVTGKNMNDSIRIARTETGRAENSGRFDSYKQAEKQGLKLKKKWLSTIDGRTRERHINLMGQERELDDTFSNGLMFPGDNGPASEVVNCFIGETLIYSDSPIKNSFKHWYEGELITVKTATGIEFTGTPNHPILTDKGWVALGSLNKTYNLVVGNIANDFVSRVNPNINTINTSMVEFHNSVKGIFKSKWVSSALVNFHSYIPHSNVEIVFIKSFLKNWRKSSFFNFVKKINFKFSGFKRLFLSCYSFINKFRFRSFFTSSCFVRFFGNISSFFKRRIFHSNIHCFASVPRFNIRFSKNSINNLPRYSEELSKCLNGFTGVVEFDQIVDINRIVSSCHVYNLHTENNLYLINSIPKNNSKCNGKGIIVHNCRCTTIVEFEGLEKGAKEIDLDEKLKEMSYKQWGEYRNVK